MNSLLPVASDLSSGDAHVGNTACPCLALPNKPHQTKDVDAVANAINPIVNNLFSQIQGADFDNKTTSFEGILSLTLRPDSAQAVAKHVENGADYVIQHQPTVSVSTSANTVTMFDLSRLRIHPNKQEAVAASPVDNVAMPLWIPIGSESGTVRNRIDAEQTKHISTTQATDRHLSPSVRLTSFVRGDRPQQSPLLTGTGEFRFAFSSGRPASSISALAVDSETTSNLMQQNRLNRLAAEEQLVRNHIGAMSTSGSDTRSSPGQSQALLARGLAAEINDAVLSRNVRATAIPKGGPVAAEATSILPKLYSSAGTANTKGQPFRALPNGISHSYSQASLVINDVAPPRQRSRETAGASALEPFFEASMAGGTHGVQSVARPAATPINAESMPDAVLQLVTSVKSHTEINGKFPARLEVELDPPELGHVSLELTESRQGLLAKITTNRESTAVLVEHQLAGLRHALQESGIEVRDFQINYADSQPQSGDPHPDHESTGTGDRETEVDPFRDDESDAESINHDSPRRTKENGRVDLSL